MPTSRFIQRFQDKITGVLSGFDRIVIRGTLRRIVFVEGMKALLWHKQILLKQFGGWAEKLTVQLKLELVPRLRKCLFLYHYWIDPHFGWMNARIPVLASVFPSRSVSMAESGWRA